MAASENHRRFSRLGLDKQIIPIHADAASLPFADDYFDAAISIDAYHYFGGNDHYFDRHLRPLLRDGALAGLALAGLALAGLALAGLKNELPGGIPQEQHTGRIRVLPTHTPHSPPDRPAAASQAGPLTRGIKSLFKKRSVHFHLKKAHEI